MQFHPKPIIYGMEALALTEPEKKFFAKAKPFGFILFARNIKSTEQVCDLVKELADYSPFAEALVFIDQEGGRVARLRPPLMSEYPSGEFFGKIYQQDKAKGLEAIRLAAKSLAGDLRRFGIGANCAPVCDVGAAETHAVIGDRAFGQTAESVTALAGAQAEGLLQAGVYPVIKHIPGHGRATADSHETLPKVSAPKAELQAKDFVPFKALAGQLFAMTAHILFEDLDKQNPVTLSKPIIDEVIRGEIGFKNLLMSDDLSMKALQGDFGERTSRALQAGCDLILHCNGDMAEMQEIDSALGDMEDSRLALFANRAMDMQVPLQADAWNAEWLDFKRQL